MPIWQGTDFVHSQQGNIRPHHSVTESNHGAMHDQTGHTHTHRHRELARQSSTLWLAPRHTHTQLQPTDVWFRTRPKMSHPLAFTPERRQMSTLDNTGKPMETHTHKDRKRGHDSSSTRLRDDRGVGRGAVHSHPHNTPAERRHAVLLHRQPNASTA